MIISGKFVALSKYTDFEDVEGVDMPLVVWFNLENIVALSIYENRIKLTIDPDHYLILKTATSNKLVQHLRKERDDKVLAFFDNLSESERERVNEYVKKMIKKEDK